MQAHVKTRHIEINIRGEIPHDLLSCLKNHYGKKVKLVKEDDDEPVDIFATEWFKKISEKTSAGDGMRIYRELHHLTQEELGERLGGISKQNISHMERGKRPISLQTAKKLAKMFEVSVEHFIDPV